MANIPQYSGELVTAGDRTFKKATDIKPLKATVTSSYRSRSVGVDILRILSVGIVVASHYAIYPPLDVGGTRGVVIFFMISGFCMAYSMQGRSGAQFLIARMVRLVPTLIICATITTLFEQAFREVRPDRLHSWSDYAYNVLCLPLGNLVCDAYFQLSRDKPSEYLWVDGAYWSLLVELRFYFLLWFLAYIARIRQVSMILALTACLAAAGGYVPWLSKGNDFLPYLSFFAFGLAIRESYDGKKGAYMAAALAAASFVVNALSGVDAISLSLSIDNMPGYAACFLVFVGVLYVARDQHSKIIGRIGVLTYPIYLLHQDIGLIVISGLSPHLGPSAARLFAIAISVFLAIVVQWLVESLRFRKRTDVGLPPEEGVTATSGR